MIVPISLKLYLVTNIFFHATLLCLLKVRLNVFKYNLKKRRVLKWSIKEILDIYLDMEKMYNWKILNEIWTFLIASGSLITDSKIE